MDADRDHQTVRANDRATSDDPGRAPEPARSDRSEPAARPGPSDPPEPHDRPQPDYRPVPIGRPDASDRLDPRVRIGHVHLKVADLERALDFYCGVLGFELTQSYGSQAAFVSAGGYHHHIGLNTWESAGGSPPAPGTTGLYHLAIVYPTRAALAEALRRLLAAGVSPDGAADHGVSEAIYLRDPDENGIELYWDRPEEEWPRAADGKLAMSTRRLDLHKLLREAPGGTGVPEPESGPRDL